MTLPPRTRRLAAAAVCLFLPLSVLAAPVAVNDNYSVNEDSILNTSGADILSVNFEPAGNVLTGSWQFLDRIKNDQNGQTPDTYPVDGTAQDWKAAAY